MSLPPLCLIFVGLQVALAAPGESKASENWPRFRGAAGNPIVGDDARLPEKWSTTENVAWVADIPGVGWSSPVIWGNKVFLTTVVNDQEAENEQPKRGLYLGEGRRGIPSGLHHWLVYCLDLESGKLLWKHEALKGKPRAGRHPKSSYAAETPVVDSEHVYALFGDHGLYCYDHDGNLQWDHRIETKKTMYDYGAAASPVVHDNQVIYVYDNNEASYVSALDTDTGEQKWRTARDEKSTWATPLVWQTEERTEIVIPGKNRIRSYDLNGDVLWEMDGQMSNLVIPSPFVAEGLVYVSSGYFADQKRPGFAVKPGATGDISLKEGATANDYVQWFQPKAGPYNTSPLVHDGIYYLLLDRGMMSAYNAKTGEQYYDRIRFDKGEDRVPPTFTSGPWAYNGKVFCLTESGKTFVLDAGKEFKVLHTNDLGEFCMSCPAIAQGNLVIRTKSKVYCLTNPKSK